MKLFLISVPNTHELKTEMLQATELYNSKNMRKSLRTFLTKIINEITIQVMRDKINNDKI